MAWFTEKKGSYELHCSVLAAAHALSSAYESRRMTWRTALSLYLDREVTLAEIDSYDTRPGEWPDRRARNAVGSVIETVHSHCVTMSPRPSFRTVGNSAKMQERVKALQRVVDSLFERQGVESACERACLDALICGDGWVRVGAEGGEPICERIAPYRVLLDPAECVLRRPLTYYCVSQHDPEALAELYPEASEAALLGTTILTDPGSADGVSAAGRIVEVIEAVRLPAVRGGKGRRVVFTSAGVLEDKPYLYHEPPFKNILWLINPEAPYGVGLPERLSGTQEDTDRREQVIRDHEQAVAGMWLVPTAANIEPEELDNGLKILKYAGPTPPTYVFPTAVATDVYQSRDASTQAAFRFSGVSELAATGERPSGVTAAAALRKVDQIASRRFTMFYKSYQNLFVWVGKMFAAMLAKEPTLRRGKMLVSLGRGMKLVRMADVRVDPDLVDVRVRVSSFNADSPPALLQELSEYFERGVFDASQVIRLSQTKDLEAEYDLLTAPQDLVDARLEAMLEGGVFAPPEPFFDLELCLKRAVLYYQLGELQGRTPAEMQLLRDFIQATLDLQGLTQPPPPPAPPPGPPMPGPPPGMGPGGPPGMLPGGPSMQLKLGLERVEALGWLARNIQSVNEQVRGDAGRRAEGAGLPSTRPRTAMMASTAAGESKRSCSATNLRPASVSPSVASTSARRSSAVSVTPPAAR